MSKLIIKGGLFFDGKNAPQEGQALIIEDNKVQDVVPVAELPAETDARVIDATGCTVLPGLIDCHVHITSSGDADSSGDRLEPDTALALRGAKNARILLESGFTTIRNMGSRNQIDIQIKRAIENGYIAGPRLITSGMCICMTGGHGWMGGREVDGVDEARKGTREQLRAGVEVIKIMATGGVMTPGVEPGSAQLTVEEMRAAVEEAHKAGRKTATHAQGTTGIKNAILAGLDSIEHGIFLDDEAIQMMLDRNVALVPTLVAPHHIVKGGVEAGIPAYAVAKGNYVYASHTESFKKALKAGVTIAFGTDCGTPLNRPGLNALEFQLMVEAGMTPLQALTAATSTAAQVCDRPNVGSLAKGKLADVVVVRGDVFADVTLLQNKANISYVIKDGQIAVSR
ncbi:MAG TPA: amidohydrolase family protein [Firmicutes bacterium]|jgi:imidazolonepropionase-like amidohydrolase|nr:amidohydrolase family protein [Bacillota bacterium]